MRNFLELLEAHRGKSTDEAGVYWSGGPIEVARRTWFVSNFSGVTAFETEVGLVLQVTCDVTSAVVLLP